MKVEKINDNKIKVLIDNEEAQKMNITEAMLSSNTPEIQRMFRRAIALAEESANFYIDGAKLFVETIPAYTDGIGMLITKVSNNKELEKAVDNCAYKGKLKRSEIPPVNGRVRRHRKYIYRFSSFDDVCMASRCIASSFNSFDGISTLYKMDEMFYLYMVPREPVAMGDINTMLCEFSEKIPHGQYMHGRLNEYGKKMIENNAVFILSTYF